MTIIKEVRILQHQVKDEYDESSRSVTTAKSIQAENTALAVSAASERVSISATQTPTSGTQSVGTAVPGETPHSQTPGEGVSSAREGDPVVPTSAQPAVATPVTKLIYDLKCSVQISHCYVD